VASTFFKDLYDEAESGTVGATVPAGTYDVEVDEARGYDEGAKPMIFLELKVLNGPAAGKAASVNITFPTEDAKKGMRIFFQRKINGFLTYPDVKAAFQTPTESVKQGLDVIADALLGKRVTAEIGIQSQGAYAGTNELRSTAALAPGATSAPAVAAQPTVAPSTEANGEVEVPSFADTVRW
jgi:hypothetical protein